MAQADLLRENTENGMAIYTNEEMTMYELYMVTEIPAQMKLTSEEMTAHHTHAAKNTHTNMCAMSSAEPPLY